MSQQDKIAIESLASDLKRVSFGISRNSLVMAKRFWQEGLKRIEEIEIKNMPNYIRKILKNIQQLKIRLDHNRMAEDCLMYSVLLQNFSQNKF